MKSIFIIITTLLLLVPDYSQAQTEKYRLTYRDDPSTTIVVAWSGALAQVYYGTTDEGTNWANYPLSKGVDRTTAHRDMNNRFARLTNLQPGTVYYFVVKDFNGNVSDRFSFRTISDDPDDPISFIAGGDSRQGTPPVENCNCRQARQDGNTLVSKLRPDFIAFNGDHVRNLNIPFISDGDEEWQEWLDDWQLTIASDGRMFPVISTVGNHENTEDLDKLFDVPEPEVYYAMNFGGNLFRLYSLNSETDACADVIQKGWFTNDLDQYSTSSNYTYWKIVQYHQPMVPQAQYNPRSDMIQCWAPLFDQHKVRLVLESHTHVLHTSYPVVTSSDTAAYEGFIRNDSLGYVFTGGGTWGAPRRSPYSAFPFTREVSGQFDAFFYIRVSKDTMRVQTPLFSNIGQVTEALDDDQGSPLPAGVSLWNAPNNAGDFIITNNNLPADTTQVGTIISAKSTGKRAVLAPNPTSSSTVNVLFKEALNEDVRIEVYNGRGQLCKTIENVRDQQYQLDLSNLCSGVNFVNIISKDDVESHKLIIAK
ncbi:MAG: fibronectin type III domain-containing protein [Saprospiraceae bacterium]|nr:fibronectin type III domain-containing protein [Saprospiraceae bacterium]